MQTISEEYRALQNALHTERNDYGVAALQFAVDISHLISENGIREVLDYGAGKGRLAQCLKAGHELEVREYDPAIPAWAATPEPAELVCCIDVLEHIEPEFLNGVLDELRRLTRRVGFFTVHTGPAAKVLADGRNAHLIQQPPSWWMPKLLERFELAFFNRNPQGFTVIVEPRAGVTSQDVSLGAMTRQPAAQAA